MELDWGQHSNSDKVPRWIPYDMQGTLRVWITRAWPPYARLTFQKVYQKTFSGDREPRWNPVSPTIVWLSTSCAVRKETYYQYSEPYPTQSEKRKNIHDTHGITLKWTSTAWKPLGWSWSNYRQTARDQVQSYSFVPTTMCLELVDAIRFVPWGAYDIQWPSPLAACLVYRAHR